MKQRLVRSAQRRIVQRLRARFELVKPRAAQGLFNLRCFENVVQYVQDRPEEPLGIVEAIYIDNEQPVLHYLVHDSAAGEYLEVTLGWRAPYLEFYRTRPIHPSDWDSIHSEFYRAAADWCEEFVGWFGRKILRIDRVL